MDWTVNDSLYHHFLKWKLKCENILECELAALPEPQQYKKLTAWSGNFGMDQYVSWGLTKDELELGTIWSQFEAFCKPQSNKVCARFDLLTIFCQGSKSVDEWYNSVQAQINLAKYPPETAKILHRDIFWFFLHDKEFVFKTINEGSVDLDKFPASKVHQLAKKYETSNATVRHIKQVAGEMQATQIHLMRHQCTELPHDKYKKQKPQAKPRPIQNKCTEQKQASFNKKSFDPRGAYKQKDRCRKCGDSAHLEGFTCPVKKDQCKSCHKFGHLTSLCFMKGQQKQAYHKHCKPKAHQLTAGTIQAYDSQSDSEGSDNSFCLQLQVKHVQAQTKVDKKTCLIINLPYRLKMHENRNLYLRARLDTCADVNIMPASVYKLVFQDPNLEKLIPNILQIGTYTNDTVKIVGTCKLYLIHLDTKKLIENIFYVATNDGSVLLSCKSMLALDLIQPRSRLDYLPPRQA